MPEEIDNNEIDPKTSLEKEAPKDDNPIHNLGRIGTQLSHGLSNVHNSVGAPVMQKGVRNLGVPEAFELGFMDPMN